MQGKQSEAVTRSLTLNHTRAGFLLGPAIGGAALGAGWGTGLFAALVAAPSQRPPSPSA
jgi:hypothetical protein